MSTFRSEMCVFIQQFVQNKKNSGTQTRTEGVIYTPPQCLPAIRPRMAAYLGHRAADKGRLVPQLSQSPPSSETSSQAACSHDGVPPFDTSTKNITLIFTQR